MTNLADPNFEHQCRKFGPGHETNPYQVLNALNRHRRVPAEFIDADDYSVTADIEGQGVKTFWMHDRAFMARALAKRDCPDFHIDTSAGFLHFWGREPGDENVTGVSIYVLGEPRVCDISLPRPEVKVPNATSDPLGHLKAAVLRDGAASLSPEAVEALLRERLAADGEGEASTTPTA